MSKPNDVAACGFQKEAFNKETRLSIGHNYDKSKFVGSNPNLMCERYYEKELELEKEKEKEKERLLALQNKNSIQVYSARSSSRHDPTSGRYSARSSARSGPATDRTIQSSHDTVAELRNLSSARDSARLSGRGLDSIRSDMSTGRLENKMKALLSEKEALLKQLTKVEEELGGKASGRSTGRKQPNSSRSSAR